VHYDDGDVRDYDMKTKTYEVLSVAQKNGGQGGQQGSEQGGGYGASHVKLFAHRPAPSQSYGTGVSYYLIDNINVFGLLGGFETMVQQLHDLCTEKQDTALRPSYPCVRTYFRLFHSIKTRIENDIMQELVLDFKEAAPLVLLSLGKSPSCFFPRNLTCHQII